MGEAAFGGFSAQQVARQVKRVEIVLKENVCRIVLNLPNVNTVPVKKKPPRSQPILNEFDSRQNANTDIRCKRTMPGLISTGNRRDLLEKKKHIWIDSSGFLTSPSINYLLESKESSEMCQKRHTADDKVLSVHEFPLLQRKK